MNIKQGNIEGSNQRESVRSRDVTLQKIGVSKNESSRLQKIANIPDDKRDRLKKKRRNNIKILKVQICQIKNKGTNGTIIKKEAEIGLMSLNYT